MLAVALEFMVALEYLDLQTLAVVVVVLALVVVIMVEFLMEVKVVQVLL
jgi:hypothetical protein